MNTFWDTVETIPEGLGFAHFDRTHLTWLAAGALFAALCCLIYRRADAPRRARLRKAMALLLLADEGWKWLGLLAFGNALPSYLPLHLCSICIFVIAVHALRPTEAIDNFLYTVCLPGALAALLFPSWTRLPVWNFSHLHSFTVHILLAGYPLMLFAGGDIRPDVRRIPQCLLLMAGLAVPALIANVLLGTNFMFLMYAEPGNPLAVFETVFGSHLIGFPIIIAGVLLVMYGPLTLLRRRRA